MLRKFIESNVLRGLPFYLSVLFFVSCSKKDFSNVSTDHTVARGITPFVFDWETVDWMPTPAGQRIPPPWIGQGSIASVYGIDVINDHKASDGWVLVYSTFDSRVVGDIVNPYFILYNKYRGIMRVYLYTTTQFVYPSTYIVDGLKVVGGPSTMLNYLGSDVVDASQKRTQFVQIEPAPIDESQPLGANKWYMLQYEIAYDPNLKNMNYQNIQLSWFTNFNSITGVSLGGTETGTLKGTIGSSESTLPAALEKGGKVAGTGVLSVIGKSVVDNNRIDSSGKNSLSLPKFAFNALSKGLESALSAAAGDIPGAIVGIFNGIFGGKSSSQTVDMTLNTTISLSGTLTEKGSFPSSPTSVYVPGTDIPVSAQNYIPLYNQPLGVFNLTRRPIVYKDISTTPDENGYYRTDYSAENLQNILVVNPVCGGPVNMNTAVVIIDPTVLDSASTYDYHDLNPSVQALQGDIQSIGTHIVFSQPFDDYGEPQQLSTFYTHSAELNGPNQNIVALRVSFDLASSDPSAPKVSFIKTFLADVVTTYHQ